MRATHPLVEQAFAAVIHGMPLQLDPSWQIVDCIDTRDWQQEDDGKWHPVPGSGEEHLCDHCNTKHVVHVKIAKYDNQHNVLDAKIIGYACAKKMFGSKYGGSWKPMLDKAHKKARKMSYEKWKKSKPAVPQP